MSSSKKNDPLKGSCFANLLEKNQANAKKNEKNFFGARTSSLVIDEELSSPAKPKVRCVSVK